MAHYWEKSNLSDKQLNTMSLLFDHGRAPLPIAKVLTEAVYLSTGKKGEFLSSTMHNTGAHKHTVMDQMSGIGHNWTVTQQLFPIIEG